MAIREELVLDLSQALSQLDDLERSLDSLIQPVKIPVEVDAAPLKEVTRELDESEDAARGLAGEVAKSIRESTKLDDELHKVAREMGLSKKEAGQFVRQMRKAEDAADDTADQVARIGRAGQFKSLTKGVLAFGAALGGIAALRAVGGFFADSISAASDLEESVGKATVVFGEFFGDIEKFTETAPQALGLSTAAALEMTGTFGNLFVALGLSQQAATDLSPQIVQLGADLASFNNLEVTDALDKLRAGLVGEAEPLRALGVNLTAATTTAKALELGLVDVNGVVTEAGKVQARYALILEQTQTAQGDFARTSDGLANTLRTLSGEFDNFKAGVGEALTPAFEAIVSALPPALELMEDLIPLIADMAAGFADAVDDGEGLVTTLTNMATATGAASDVLPGFGRAIAGFFKGAGLTAFSALFDIENVPTAGLDAWTEALDDFNETWTNLSIRKIKGTLFEKLAEIDPDPVKALVESIESLQFLDLDIETFTSSVERFFRIAGIEGPEAARIFEILSTRGGDFGFTADQVAVLVAVMRELFGITGALAPRMDEIAFFAGQAGRAAAEGADGIDEFAVALEELRRADIDEIIASLEAQFDRLPDALEGAAAAMRDAEGEIVSDFSDFLDNLDAELDVREEFAANIATLIGLDFPLLAGVFEEGGLEMRQALIDALANPAELAAAEARLEAFGRALASAEALAFLSQIQTEVDTASEFIVEITPVLDDLDFGVLPVLENLLISGTFGAGGNITVNQFFGDTPTPDTDTERAGQEIAAIIETRS